METNVNNLNVKKLLLVWMVKLEVQAYFNQLNRIPRSYLWLIKKKKQKKLYFIPVTVHRKSLSPNAGRKYQSSNRYLKLQGVGNKQKSIYIPSVCLSTTITHNYKSFNQVYILLIVARCVEQTQFKIILNTKCYRTHWLLDGLH